MFWYVLFIYSLGPYGSFPLQRTCPKKPMTANLGESASVCVYPFPLQRLFPLLRISITTCYPVQTRDCRSRTAGCVRERQRCGFIRWRRCITYDQFQDKMLTHGAAARRRIFLFVVPFSEKSTYSAAQSSGTILPPKDRGKCVIFLT